MRAARAGSLPRAAEPWCTIDRALYSAYAVKMSSEPPEHPVDLVEWCREQRAIALKNIEIIDRDNFHMGDAPGQPSKDHTSALRATYARIFEEMGHLLKEYGGFDPYNP